MPSKKTLTTIVPGATYHIFNRGVNRQNVFFCQSDYQFFLDKLKFYIHPFVDIFAYILLPNHYHILLSVKEETQKGEFNLQFSRFILSYTNIINKRENRSGNLFLKTFKRLRINENEYLVRLIFYIHNNPEHHKITDDFRLYKYSSYGALISNLPTLLARREVISWFDDLENFKAYHEQIHDEEMIKKLIME